MTAAPAAARRLTRLVEGRLRLLGAFERARVRIALGEQIDVRIQLRRVPQRVGGEVAQAPRRGARREGREPREDRRDRERQPSAPFTMTPGSRGRPRKPVTHRFCRSGPGSDEVERIAARARRRTPGTGSPPGRGTPNVELSSATYAARKRWNARGGVPRDERREPVDDADEHAATPHSSARRSAGSQRQAEEDESRASGGDRARRRRGAPDAAAAARPPRASPSGRSSDSGR